MKSLSDWFKEVGEEVRNMQNGPQPWEAARDAVTAEYMKDQRARALAEQYSKEDNSRTVDAASFAAYANWRERYEKEHDGRSPTEAECIGAMGGQFSEYTASSYGELYGSYSVKADAIDRLVEKGVPEEKQHSSGGHPLDGSLEDEFRETRKLVDEAAYGFDTMSPTTTTGSMGMETSKRYAAIMAAMDRYTKETGFTVKGKSSELSDEDKKRLQLFFASERTPDTGKVKGLFQAFQSAEGAQSEAQSASRETEGHSGKAESGNARGKAAETRRAQSSRYEQAVSAMGGAVPGSSGSMDSAERGLGG